MFCKKCGSILKPKKIGDRTVMGCSCGFVDKGAGKRVLVDFVKKKKEIEVIEKSAADSALPLTDMECPKCKHEKAYFWTIQTRAGDEPETKFLKCQKCNHVWRDYS